MARSSITGKDLMGPRTALVYTSASAYAAANWAFLQGGKEQALYFPYTAPSAVPGEVTIQFGMTGPYLSFLSGANAGIEALWHAATLLTTDQCDRALVLGVETVMECEDLFAAGRWLLSAPLVEAVTCLLLERHASLSEVVYRASSGADGLTVLEAELDRQVPAIVYLLVHGGMPALKGIGLMSWGSMNSFALTAIPLFILMAEIMQHSGLSFRIYRGLSKLVCVIPGGLLQTNIAGCALFAAISGSSVPMAS